MNDLRQTNVLDHAHNPVVPPTGATIAEPASLPETALNPQRQSMSEAKPVRIMLADDHQLVREGLAAILKEEPGIDVVGEAHDGQHAVELAAELMPDVVLMDLTMPRMNGIEATRLITRELPGVRVIGLSMYTHEDAAHAMQKAGAAAFVTKDGTIDHLVATIRQCVRQKHNAALVSDSSKW